MSFRIFDIGSTVSPAHGVGSGPRCSTPAGACIEAPGTHTMDRGLRSLLLGRDPKNDYKDKVAEVSLR